MKRLAVAIAGAQQDAVRALLHADVTLVIDSGGTGPIDGTSCEGRDPVARALCELMPPEISLKRTAMNGTTGLAVIRDARVIAAINAEVTTGLVRTVWIVSNPHKLRHWNRG
ncbi:hypothetical protein [Microbacterium sp.]|uniref:hypothetical protein n=1 Tax=Microbacterium sp. TaxID=51671 RepID=UPI0028125CCA|nr:hypothetical protein [Microbacterium sp.]